MWEEAVVDTRFRYHADISLEGLMKIEEDLSTVCLWTEKYGQYLPNEKQRCWVLGGQ